MGINSIHIMSGFRTPFYNRALGNVLYSMHQWGGAADIFIDNNPRDGQMDDLNQDGKINVEDAKFLSDIIDRHFHKECDNHLIGGLSFYKRTAAHGPFVHMDVRGKSARW